MPMLRIYAGQHGHSRRHLLMEVSAGSTPGAMKEAIPSAASLMRAYGLSGIAIRDVIGGLRAEMWTDDDGNVQKRITK